MFKLASWISDSRSSDKATNGALCSKMSNGSLPVVEIQPIGDWGKRKRSVSVEVHESIPHVPLDEAKRRKLSTSKPESEPPKAIVDASAKSQPKKAVVNTSRIRDTIDAQFSLEILLKHKELRLIDQELARCQVALEQLRRCHLIPYPTTEPRVESLLSITDGTGPAIRRGSNVPQWAPPYGVADGPYTRHYAKWLIPDATFDGRQPEWQREPSRAGKTVPEGRSTRYSITDTLSPYAKSRSQRGSQGQKFQALSHGYPVEKAKVGPCVLTRNDGQTVKLVCIDCNRENFSSTQGFINHCRIAHKREFKSHEEAATVSGQPYDGEAPVKPVVEDKIAVPQTPVQLSSSVAGFVHPLVRSTPVDSEAYKSLLSRIDSSVAMFHQGKLPGVTSIPSSTTTTPSKHAQPLKFTKASNIVPSVATPRLSAWLGNTEWTGDLAKIVDEATKKVDFDDISSQDGESDYDEQSPSQSFLNTQDSDNPAHIMRMPARVNMSPAPHRPNSSKGFSPRPGHATPVINTSIAHFDRPSRLYNGLHGSADGNIDLEMMDAPSVTDLSPHTVASNNAPSLVSDDGEYDDGDDADSATSERDDADSVAEIDIEDDSVDKVVPRNVLQHRAGVRGENGMRKEDKHVTFMSPVKEGKEMVHRN